jgi:hypothetical protein
MLPGPQRIGHVPRLRRIRYGVAQVTEATEDPLRVIRHGYGFTRRTGTSPRPAAHDPSLGISDGEVAGCSIFVRLGREPRSPCQKPSRLQDEGRFR